MAYRYECRGCSHPCADTYVCPVCGHKGPKSPSPDEHEAIVHSDLESFGRLIRLHRELREARDA